MDMHPNILDSYNTNQDPPESNPNWANMMNNSSEETNANKKKDLWEARRDDHLEELYGILGITSEDTHEEARNSNHSTNDIQASREWEIQNITPANPIAADLMGNTNNPLQEQANTIIQPQKVDVNYVDLLQCFNYGTNDTQPTGNGTLGSTSTTTSNLSIITQDFASPTLTLQFSSDQNTNLNNRVLNPTNTVAQQHIEPTRHTSWPSLIIKEEFVNPKRLCVKCNIEFSRPFTARRHEKICREDQYQRMYKCRICQKQFITIRRAKKHELDHWFCEYCGRKAEDKCGCEGYKCNQPDCLYTSKIKDNLKRHRLQHFEQSPYQCKQPGCKYTSNDPSNIKRHQRTVHKSKPKVNQRRIKT